jgi:all-trans-retinol dehydrogenase (NAD+)
MFQKESTDRRTPMADLKQRFEQAAEEVQHLPERPGNDVLLQLYALYKQATEGDVTGRRPGFTDFRGRAKYDAWAGVRGTSQEEAMEAYVDLVLTGAANGIGRLLAERLAAEGARLALWDVDAAGLAAVEQACADAPGTVTTYRCDLTDRAQIYAAAEKVHADLGPVDVLINNAGVVSGKPLLEIEDEEILRTFDVNALALFWTTRAFLPAMIAQGHGHVVTIASAAGIVGTARLTDYSASKFAAVGFDESLRLEMKRLGLPIHTTVVCPFYIGTEMFRGARTRFSWLLPILTPEYAVRRILTAIRKKRRRLIMPRFVYLTYPIRALPVRAFDALLKFFGVTTSMDAFVGHDGP